ncbi:MAG: PHA/PHB synthase family protein [Acidimicrobiales bacterium]
MSIGPPGVPPALDPVGLGPALARLGTEMVRHPLPALRHTTRLTTALATAAAQSTARGLGWKGDASLQPGPGDRRFADPAWQEHPWFLAQQQAYLAVARYLRDVAGGAPSEPDAKADKAAVAVELLVDALAPTNTLWGNPAALRAALQTRGASVLEGFANLAEDLADNGGRPRQVDRSAFRVGEDLACTPGKVVYRNDLIELLQYQPTTPDVYDVPLLLSPPWINRYYIMDLAPGRSFVEWAVAHGHTTFTISYRNPGPDMGHLRLQDYLHDGLGHALDAVRDITGAPQVNVAGLCVGGTLAVMLLAWMAHDGPEQQPVRSLTLLNTLVDFSRPGRLGAFTDADAVARVERHMNETGVLDGQHMASTFDALRPNDLIWNYVGTNWLMGQPPPAFDILAWNADSTCIPAATHAEYLRSMYLENRLARDELEIGGRRLEVGRVATDVYVLAAKEDHITPWRSSYATTGLLGGDVRFVLSSSGHIAGIVNPPGPKRKHWLNDDVAPSPEDWLAAATEHGGSWWDDWAAWIGARAGGRRPPPAFGNDHYPVLGDAPGTYVHG